MPYSGAFRRLRKQIAGRYSEQIRREARSANQSAQRELLHPYCGYALNSKAPTSAWRRAGWEKPRINSWGFVGNEPLERHPDEGGWLKVAITGGSAARHFFEQCGESIAQELAVRIGRRSGESVCFALEGFKQPQQLNVCAFFLALGARYDVVINLDGFNEVALHESENALFGTHFSYPRVWALRAQPAQTSLVHPAVLIEGLAQLRRWHHIRLLMATKRGSLPAVLLSVIFARLLRDLHRWSKVSEKYRDRRSLKAGAAGPWSYEQLADLWCRSSTLLRALIEESGGSYYHFLQPNQYLEGSKRLSSQERRVAFRHNHPYRAGVVLGYPALKLASKSLLDQGVSFKDLTQVFRDEVGTVYVDDCCHWNYVGNEKIRRAIQEFVCERLRDAHTLH